MTDARLQRLVRELIAQDASLQGRESDLTRIVEALLQNDLTETPSPAFVTTLREDLRVHAQSLADTPMRRWTRILPMLLTSSAAVTALLLITLPFAKDALRNNGEPPEIPSIDDGNQELLIQPYSTGTEDNANGEDMQMRMQESVPANEGGGFGGAVPEGTTSNETLLAPMPNQDPDTSVSAPDAAAGSTAVPMNTMQADPATTRQQKISQPEITIPASLAVPADLPGTALMHDPELGDRMITVYSLPSAQDAQYEILAQVIQRLGEQTAPRRIDAGLPKMIVITYPFESLPGPVEVQAWSFSDIKIDGKLLETFLTDPVIVPLQLPTYE